MGLEDSKVETCGVVQYINIPFVAFRDTDDETEIYRVCRETERDERSKRDEAKYCSGPTKARFTPIERRP